MAWDRRRLGRLLVLAAATPWLAAFSPRGLDTWRQHSLFVLFHDVDRSDREAVVLVTGRLVEKLPESRAASLPVADLRQLGDLLLSQQYDVALLRVVDVAAISARAPALPGAMSGPLVLLARIRDHLLICRSDLAADRAAVIAAALSDLTPKHIVVSVPSLPWHSAVAR